MRILLDENFPVDFAKLFIGHEIATVHSLGWSGIENGELLRRAHSICDVFVTLDRNLEFQQNIKVLPFGVVVVNGAAPDAPKSGAPLSFALDRGFEQRTRILSAQWPGGCGPAPTEHGGLVPTLAGYEPIPRATARIPTEINNPTRARVSETGGKVTTRPNSPRLSCRMPLRIWAPISLERCLVIFNVLSTLVENSWTISVTEFKAKCLHMIRQVEAHGTPIDIVRRGRWHA